MAERIRKSRSGNSPDRESPERSPTPRLGPRPLQLHMAMAGATWTQSRLALALWKSGSLPWRPELQDRAETLEGNLRAADLEVLQKTLDEVIGVRGHRFWAAIEAYRNHPYRRAVPEPPVVWQEGSTHLLDYGATAGGGGQRNRSKRPVILMVPSLVNRAYILDLQVNHSLMRWLAGRGFRPYLVDWGHPGPAERGFDLTDYVAGRLEGALDHVLSLRKSTSGPKPVIMGYCMGGLLALALALRRPKDLSAAAFLATPWDFHQDSAEKARLLAASLLPMAPMMEVARELPVDAIQSLFSVLDPLQVLRKFLAFSQMDPASAKAEAFVALEDWLNDGVPLTLPVARECLGRWYGENTPAEGGWRLAGRPVEPRALTLPALCVVPGQDRIVPPNSALALARALPNCQVHRPAAGHIGMVASKRAPKSVWDPLEDWVLSLSR